MMDNQLLKGLIDKNQVGSGAEYGLVHSFNELYGEKTTGKLLTCLTKLFMNYLQSHGFTCGLDDLILHRKSNKTRREDLSKGIKTVVEEVCHEYHMEPPKTEIDYIGRSLYKCDEEGNYMPEEKPLHMDKTEEIVKFFDKKIT